MRRMFSEKQIEKMIQEGSLSPEEVQEMLIGKYVRIMDAPKSTTLTDEQIAQIEEGVFINGEFLGFINPIIFPCRLSGTDKYGLVLGVDGSGHCLLNPYKITGATKVISLAINLLRITNNGALAGNFYNLQLNGKAFPANPSNTGTFTLKFVNGTLTWVED